MVYDRTTAPNEWQTLPLGEAVDILDSRRVPVNSEERAKRIGDVPYYGATGQAGWIDDYIFDEELVLLGEDGAPFLDHAKPKAYIVRGKAWVNNHAHVLRGKAGILLNSFLLHQLNRVDYGQYVSGTTRLKLPQAPLRRIQLLVPPLDEQQRIVAEIEQQFTRLDAGAASLKRVQVALKRYRASVLKAACEGRLVPIEAELARQENRSYETGEQLLQRILKERREKWNGRRKYKEPAAPDLVDLPTLPEGWTWVTAEQLSDASRAITYGVIKLGVQVDDGISVLRSSDVRHLRLDLEGVKRISPSIAGEFKRTFLHGNEVLVTVRGTLGGVVAVPGSCKGFNISREVAMIALVKSQLATFVAAMIASPPIQLWLLRRTKGIAYTGINIETLKQLPIPLPPLAEQQRIVAELERRLSVIEELEALVADNLQRANRLRPSVLHRAFSGRFSKS